jgi:hypothetical protein
MKRVALHLALGSAITALSMMPASAQMGGGGHHRGNSDQKAAPKTSKVDEKAYKSALEKIPDSKEKFDPWGSLGVSSSAKKPK